MKGQLLPDFHEKTGYIKDSSVYLRLVVPWFQSRTILL